MIKILMVCLGNICRSPMAEGVFRDELRKHGIDAQIGSAGTAAYHVGEGADPRTQSELREHGIDISDERAQKFIPAHFGEYDYIFAMDRSNYSDIVHQTDSEEERAKVDMLMNLVSPGRNIPVPDPYYGGPSGFADNYRMIKQAAEAFVEKLSEK